MAKTCNNCGTNPEKKTGYDLAVAVCERTTKRLWIALIIVICMLFASNGIWLYCWIQYDYVGEEQIIEAQQDGEGVNIVGGGDIDYGSDSEDNKEQESTP